MSSKLDRIRIEPNQNQYSLRVIDIPLDVCRLNPHQPRKIFDEGALKDLAASITQHGLLQPVTVTRDKRKKNHFILVAGERRFRAFQSLNRETIPAIVTTGNPAEIALIENLQREDLSAVEEAEALARLKKVHGYNNVELGKAIGKARSTISHLLKINDLPRKIRDEAVEASVSKSVIIELAKIKDKKEQLNLWTDIKERGATVKQIRKQKKTPEELEESQDKRLISTGKRFVTELERITSGGSDLSADKYEELLTIYERFVNYMTSAAKAQKDAE